MAENLPLEEFITYYNMGEWVNSEVLASTLPINLSNKVAVHLNELLFFPITMNETRNLLTLRDWS